MNVTHTHERYWNKVDKQGPVPSVPGLGRCWEWIGGTVPTGYGRFKVGLFTYRAHRYSWILANGKVPKGLELHHLCNNRRCVNPAHLRLISHADHMKLSLRANQTHCWRGHLLSGDNMRRDTRGNRTCKTCATIRLHARRAHLPRRAKLSPEKVREIRAWAKDRKPGATNDRGADTVTAVAKLYGVSRQAIQAIMNDKTWRAIE